MPSKRKTNHKPAKVRDLKTKRNPKGGVGEIIITKPKDKAS